MTPRQNARKRNSASPRKKSAIPRRKARSQKGHQGRRQGAQTLHLTGPNILTPSKRQVPSPSQQQHGSDPDHQTFPMPAGPTRLASGPRTSIPLQARQSSPSRHRDQRPPHPQVHTPNRDPSRKHKHKHKHQLTLPRPMPARSGLVPGPVLAATQIEAAVVPVVR